MIEKYYFKVQNEFVEDLGNLSGSAVKLYLILRKHVNEKRDDGNMVFPSYKEIQRLLNTASSSTVTKAIKELYEAGWIEKIIPGNSFTHHANTYYMADKKIIRTSTENNGSPTIENDGTPTVNNSEDLPSKEVTNKTNNNKGNSNKKNRNKTNFPVDFYEETKYLGYPRNCAWLLKIMVDADVFTSEPPNFIQNEKSAKKWAAQLNNLVLLGAKEEIRQIIPICLFGDLHIDEPAQITSRLEDHIASARMKREKEWEKTNGRKITVT